MLGKIVWARRALRSFKKLQSIPPYKYITINSLKQYLTPPPALYEAVGPCPNPPQSKEANEWASRLKNIIQQINEEGLANTKTFRSMIRPSATPHQVRKACRSYFKNLFKISEINPLHDRPWLRLEIWNKYHRAIQQLKGLKQLSETISIDELNYQFQNAKTTSSPGPDNIEYGFFKALGPKGAELVLNAFNSILNGAPFPEEAKNMEIMMIHKGGDPSILSIALLKPTVKIKK
jgi:hypothetical protein